MLLAGESLEALHEREEEALSNLFNESAAVSAFILFINHAENVKTREGRDAPVPENADGRRGVRRRRRMKRGKHE